MTETLPPLPTGLTAPWLTTLLRRVGVAPANATIVDVARTPVGEGIGMMSELSRLHLTWSPSRPDLPQTIIAKYASTNPTNRAVAASFHIYEREVRYFLEVDAKTNAQTPRCYYGQLEPENFLLLLEDLGDYRVGSQLAGAGFDDSALAIDQLCALHAPFWNRVDELDWVPKVANSYHADSLRNLANSGWDNMVKNFGAHLAPEIRVNRDRILVAIPKLQATMVQAPLTFVHGDYRLDNLLFASAPTHVPVAILDWQGPLRAKGVVDVALLLGQNTQVEVRRAHEQTLIRRYSDGLAKLGVNYSPEQAWSDYLDALLYQWAYTVAVVGGLDSSNPRSTAWMSQLVARHSAATMDHKLLAKLEQTL